MKKPLIFMLVCLIAMASASAIQVDEADFNGDYKVDLKDIQELLLVFGKTSGFDSKYDVNGNGKVGLFDLVGVARHLGAAYSCEEHTCINYDNCGTYKTCGECPDPERDLCYLPSEEPIPLETDYFLGAYYMPKPRYPTHQWANVIAYNREPDVKNAGAMRLPILGFYPGDSPEVLDWQIKWAVEHGINFFIFDEYWVYTQDTPVYNIGMEAFSDSQYKDHIRFAVMITTSAIPNDDRELAKEKLTTDIAAYYRDNYFSKSNYLRIDGKPVVVVVSNQVFWDWVPERIQAVMDDFEETTGTEVYWVYQAAQTDESNIQSISAWGFDAIAPYYVFPLDASGDPDEGLDYSTVIDYIQSTNAWFLDMAEQYNLHYFPTASINFDERPRYRETWKAHRHFSKDPSLEGFRTILQNIKDLADGGSPAIPRINNKPVIGLPPFNEWEEDSDLEPGISLPNPGEQFGLLDAVAEVFSGEDFTYQGPVPQTPYTASVPSQRIWNFGKEEDIKLIYIPPFISDVEIMVPDRHGRVKVNDNNKLTFDIASNIDLDGYKGVYVAFRAECSGKNPCTASVFANWFSTTYPEGAELTDDPTIEGENLLGSAGLALSQCSSSDDNDWLDCRIIPSENPNNPTNPDDWRGRLEDLQLIFYLDTRETNPVGFPVTYHIGLVQLIPK